MCGLSVLEPWSPVWSRTMWTFKRWGFGRVYEVINYAFDLWKNWWTSHGEPSKFLQEGCGKAISSATPKALWLPVLPWDLSPAHMSPPWCCLPWYNGRPNWARENPICVLLTYWHLQPGVVSCFYQCWSTLHLARQGYRFAHSVFSFHCIEPSQLPYWRISGCKANPDISTAPMSRGIDWNKIARARTFFF